MSDITKRVCDSCGKDAFTTDELSDAFGWPVILVGTPAAGNSALHACWDCIPKMMEIFPKNNLHLHCRHEVKIECTSDEVRVLTGQFMQLSMRPGGLLGRMDQCRLEIQDRASDWVVNDIKVNGRSQLAQAGDIPGDCFAPGAMGTVVTFESIKDSAQFVLCATYVGKNPEGAQLRYMLIGKVPGIRKASDPESTVIKGDVVVPRGAIVPVKAAKGTGSNIDPSQPQ